MSDEHDWVLDLEESRNAAFWTGGYTVESPVQIFRCSKCGCVRITDWAKLGTENVHRYKPMEWTWNPFKMLTEEPPCPARWP